MEKHVEYCRFPIYYHVKFVVLFTFVSGDRVCLQPFVKELFRGLTYAHNVIRVHVTIHDCIYGLLLYSPRSVV